MKFVFLVLGSLAFGVQGFSQVIIGGKVDSDFRGVGVIISSNALLIATPLVNTVFQRTGSTGNIPITGIVGIGVHTIEARFNGGAWVAITSAVGTNFSGTLSNQVQGQGSLQVRWQDNTAVVSTRTNIGIGDIFVIAGQSNASGRGTGTTQVYSHATLRASLFDNAYNWSNLTDPSDSDVGQVDSVSTDTTAHNSPWLPLATSAMGGQSVPVAFVSCAKGGSSISQWQPSANHTNRATLYGSMIYRALQVAPVKAVLWWQGENDFGTNQSYYYTNFTNMSATIFSDLGVKVLPCKLQHCDTNTVNQSDAQQAVINAAIGQAWANDPNTLAGPDLSGLETEPEDTVHLLTNAKLSSAAALWWSAIQAAYGF